MLVRPQPLEQMGKIDYAQITLGMSSGKAKGILNSMILLSMLKELGRDSCLKCSENLTDPGDISVDHKIPWRHATAELYWDLNNIAFSHKRCNKPDRYIRKVGPENTSWCKRHKKFLPNEKFGPGKRWNGFNTICLNCDRIRVAEYAAKNPRHKCPHCKTQMRKVCPGCKWEMPMKDYMKLRRAEGAAY